jgi:hypothetical protein
MNIKNCSNCLFWKRFPRDVFSGECKNMNSLSRFEPQYHGNFCSGWLGVKEGDIVYHAFYKYGKVIEISGDFIQILFNGENRARKFHRTELFETLILRETV